MRRMKGVYASRFRVSTLIDFPSEALMLCEIKSRLLHRKVTLHQGDTKLSF